MVQDLAVFSGNARDCRHCHGSTRRWPQLFGLPSFRMERPVPCAHFGGLFQGKSKGNHSLRQSHLSLPVGKHAGARCQKSKARLVSRSPVSPSQSLHTRCLTQVRVQVCIFTSCGSLACPAATRRKTLAGRRLRALSANGHGGSSKLSKNFSAPQETAAASQIRRRTALRFPAG